MFLKVQIHCAFLLPLRLSLAFSSSALVSESVLIAVSRDSSLITIADTGFCAAASSTALCSAAYS